MSIEQMVRDLLSMAIRDELIDAGQTDPQSFNGGDLCGCANLMQSFLLREATARDDRWQLAVGTSLENAEELAAALDISEAKRKS